jgi:thiamine-phosphate pyrophosphorylase
MKMPCFPASGLYAITHRREGPPECLGEAVRSAISGGAVAIQYRAKAGERCLMTARRLLQICRSMHVPLIVNDDVDLAAAIGADGVHLGRDDPTIRAARNRLGSGALVGVSCYDSLDLARDAEQDGASYVAFGRFFLSGTKPDAPPARLETLREARKVLRIPIVAIGGVTPENGAALLEAGADILAAIGGVFGTDDIEMAARRFSRLFSERTGFFSGA